MHLPLPVPFQPTQGSGWDGQPWPEYWHQRPALVIPRNESGQRPADRTAGWSALGEYFQEPHPDWHLSVTGQHLTITSPSGLWFEGDLLLTREWTRAARAARRVLLITGDFSNIAQFIDPTRAPALCLLSAHADVSLILG